MSDDTSPRGSGRPLWPWLLGRTVFIVVLVALLAGGFAAYRMLQHDGSVKQAAGNGDLVAVRAHFAVFPPSDELKRELLIVAVQSQHTDIARYLLEKGVDPNVPVREGYLPALDELLIWNPRAPKGELVELLVNYGAQLDVRHQAAMGNLEAVASAVAANPGVVNAPMPEFHNMTLLHYACAGWQYDTAKWLLDQGGDPEAKDTFGQTPLDFAIYNELEDIEKLLKEVARTGPNKP